MKPITFTRDELFVYTEQVFNEGWNAGSTARGSDGDVVSLLDQRFCDYKQSVAERNAAIMETSIDARDNLTNDIP